MNILVNNKKYVIETNKEMTILQACELINIHIPRFCYHDKLSIAGNCRMCFVELPKAKKPTLACSTAIHDGIELYTNTFVVKKAQESVLEFLLVNHPLDCPICDQGGECDLQELTKNFGSDRGRFQELKRSVEDLELGHIIKTIMTRCIHCTRCIRFASEILTVPSLGTSGRGRDTEVSMYINKILHTELSGNLVDLCPVGALTSKPYAFKARPWELSHTESIDVLDSIGSSIRIDTKGNRVMRILPRINDDLNEEWITDKIRYSYDSLLLQRLTMPSIYLNNQTYLNTSWSFILNYLSNYLIYFKKNKLIRINSGNLIDLGTTLMTYALSQTLETNIINGTSSNADLRSNYLLSGPLNLFENKEFYLVVGTNLDYESPILKLRMQKKYKQKKISYIGSYWNSVIPNSLHIGTSLKKLITILEGRSTTLFDFYKKDFIEILYRFHLGDDSSVHYHSLLKRIVKYIQVTKSSYVFSYLNTIGLSNLSINSSAIHKNEIGALNNYFSSNNYLCQFTHKTAIEFQFNPHIRMNIQDSINYVKHEQIHNSNKFTVFIGHHKPSDLDNYNYNVVLPSSTFVENKQFYMNNLGKIQFTNKALGAPGKSKSSISITSKLLSKITSKNNLEYYKKLFFKLRNYKFHLLSSTRWHLFINPTYIGSASALIIPNKLMYYFHCSDPVSSNSPLMVQLVKEKKQLESTFYNNITYSL